MKARRKKTQKLNLCINCIRENFQYTNICFLLVGVGWVFSASSAAALGIIIISESRKVTEF